jgi:uncharacterized protein YgbK (DUF1537 family)
VVVDAIDDEDLHVIAAAADTFPLMVGGSGIALGLPALYRRAGLIGERAAAWQGSNGKAVALSGSCSKATRGQVAEHARAGGPQMKIDTDAVMSGALTAPMLVDWAVEQEGLPLIYSSDDPEAVAAAQRKHGAGEVSEALETVFGDVAKGLVQRGAGRLIVAGGETSGAVVTALGLDALEIGPKIDPGVPAMRTGDLVLTLKSGNFGAPDFFHKAMTVMGR